MTGAPVTRREMNDCHAAIPAGWLLRQRRLSLAASRMGGWFGLLTDWPFPASLLEPELEIFPHQEQRIRHQVSLFLRAHPFSSAKRRAAAA